MSRSPLRAAVLGQLLTEVQPTASQLVTGLSAELLAPCHDWHMPSLDQRPAWQGLATHAAQLQRLHLRQLFVDDPARGERLVAEGAGLHLDYSKQRVTD